MNLSTETSSHRNNTSTIQTRTIQKKKKKRNKPITKNKTTTQIFMKMKLKTRDMRWGNENPYLFLEDLEVKKCKNGFVENDMKCLGEFQLREKVNSHKKFKGKTEKVLKNCLWNTKHAFFATETSCQGKPPKHSKSKLWKNFLSVFHD